MKKENWIWLPHPAHFICANECKFRLATYVGKYIVSTVGELWPSKETRLIHAKVCNPEWLQNNTKLKEDEFDSKFFREFGYENIGADRTYETMVFKAKKSKEKCCPFIVSDYCNLDMKGYNDAFNARKGHLKLCDKWSKK